MLRRLQLSPARRHARAVAIEPLEERQLLTTYYVSAVGSDSSNGTSTTTPWATVAKVNATALKAGDSVLFRGGDTFRNVTLYVNPAERATSTTPIKFGSYGTGKAYIAPSADKAGMYIYNTGGVSVSNLGFVGTGSGTGFSSTGGGIFLYNDRSDSLHFSYFRIDNVDSSYFRYGIEIGAGGTGATAGFDDVRVTNSKFHNNERAGAFSFAKNRNVHKTIYFGHDQFYSNTGVPGLYAIDHSVTGHGIVLSGVNGATIERSVSHDNGAQGDGGCGIWTYDSTKVTIQYCESYNNHTSSTHDGDGFDLDQNVSFSTIQYCYSHGNDGGGYLLCQKFATDVHTNNVIRYNVSANDGRKNNYGAIHLWGRVRNAEIYNNTVYLPFSSSGTHSAVRIHNNGLGSTVVVSHVHFRNNIFQTTGGTGLVLITPTALTGASDLKFQGNDYWPSGSGFRIDWGSSVIGSLSSFRSKGQEMNGTTSLGFNVDPKLTTPTTVTTIGNADNLATLTSYRLSSGSPLINKGLNLSTLFAVNMGTKDFWNHTTPQGAAYDVGAWDAVS